MIGEANDSYLVQILVERRDRVAFAGSRDREKMRLLLINSKILSKMWPNLQSERPSCLNFTVNNNPEDAVFVVPVHT